MKKVIIISIVFIAIIYLFDQLLHVPYAISIPIKITLFGIIPYLIYREPLRFKNNSMLLPSIILGVLSGFIVIIAYFYFSDFIDLDLIARELMNNEGITAMNFLYVSIYITFINSFLEEFFFRGFIYLQMGKTRLASIYSAALFGLYHMTIFQTWFNPWIMLLALVGLSTLGLILNWINDRSILNSWIVHILADMGVMFVGFKMFGL